MVCCIVFAGVLLFTASPCGGVPRRARAIANGTLWLSKALNRSNTWEQGGFNVGLLA